MDEYSEPHRPHKILYASLYANVTPSFVVDISAQFEARMAALLSYASQWPVAEPTREKLVALCAATAIVCYPLAVLATLVELVLRKWKGLFGRS